MGWAGEKPLLMKISELCCTQVQMYSVFGDPLGWCGTWLYRILDKGSGDHFCFQCLITWQIHFVSAQLWLIWGPCVSGDISQKETDIFETKPSPNTQTIGAFSGETLFLCLCCLGFQKQRSDVQQNFQANSLFHSQETTHGIQRTGELKCQSYLSVSLARLRKGSHGTSFWTKCKHTDLPRMYPHWKPTFHHVRSYTCIQPVRTPQHDRRQFSSCQWSLLHLESDSYHTTGLQLKWRDHLFPITARLLPALFAWKKSMITWCPIAKTGLGTSRWFEATPNKWPEWVYSWVHSVYIILVYQHPAQSIRPARQQNEENPYLL